MKREYGKTIKIIAGLLTLGLFVGLALSLALQPLSLTTTVQAANPVAAAPTPVPTEPSKKAGDKGEGMGSAYAQYLMPMLQAAASSLNLKPEELEAAILSGKSLAEVAQTQKVELSTVQTAVLSNLKTQLNGMVKDSKATQSQADKVYQTADLWFGELAGLHVADLYRIDSTAISKAILSDTATSLKLTPEQLTSELKAGKSLADIAKTQNVPIQQLKNVVLTSFNTQVDSLVKAGKVTQSQADKANQSANLWWDELATLNKSATGHK